MEPKGPKSIRTPGAASEAPAAAAVVTKDLTKTPKTEGTITAPEHRAPKVEAKSEAEALEMANELGRAVMSPNGWVCPSITHERRAAA